MLAPSRLMHLDGPLHQPANLLFQYVRRQIVHRRISVPACTFDPLARFRAILIVRSQSPAGTGYECNGGLSTVPQRIRTRKQCAASPNSRNSCPVHSLLRLTLCGEVLTLI
jgi:hypothetical protein